MSINFKDELSHSNPTYSIVDESNIRGGNRSIATFDNTALSNEFSALPDRPKQNYSTLIDRSTGDIYYLSGVTASETSSWSIIKPGTVVGSGVLNNITKWTGTSSISTSSITDDGNTVTISGNFTVLGTSSTINTQNLLVKDPIILLAASQSGTPVLDSGIFINRGTGATQGFIWDESNTEFSFIETNDGGGVIGNVTIATYSNVKAATIVATTGISTPAITISTGASNNYILKSDVSGNASWASTISLGGTSGSSGSSGASGSSGSSGASGANGSSGSSGASGANGSSGSSGANGSSGSSGANGSSGSSGLSGSSGSSGLSGSSGSSGVSGANGSSGVSGANGSSGSSGSSGVSGSSGSSGAGSPGGNGTSGSSGSAGSSGASLVNGITGIGTTNYLPIFTGTSSLSNSHISEGTYQTSYDTAATVTIVGQSQSVHFRVGAYLEYTLATSGEIVKFGATSSTVLGKLYYLGTASWNLCDASTASTSSGMLGIALGITSSIDGMLIRGNSSLTFSSWPIGDILYASTTSGGYSNVPPSGSGEIVRVIGYSKGPSELYFCPDNTWAQLL